MGQDELSELRATVASLTDRLANIEALAGSAGAILNITAADYSTAGLLAVYAASVAYPGNSTINYSAGAATATSATTAVSPAGAVKVRASGGSANFIIDVVGYYR